jgi:hypothetical protein
MTKARNPFMTSPDEQKINWTMVMMNIAGSIGGAVMAIFLNRKMLAGIWNVSVFPITRKLERFFFANDKKCR